MNPLAKISWSCLGIVTSAFLLLQSCDNQPATSAPTTAPYTASAAQGDAWDVENGYLATATTGFKEIGSGETKSLTFNTSLEAVVTTQNFTLPSEFTFTLSGCGNNKSVTVSLGESAPLENVEDVLACKVVKIEADGWIVDPSSTAGVWNIKQ